MQFVAPQQQFVVGGPAALPQLPAQTWNTATPGGVAVVEAARPGQPQQQQQQQQAVLSAGAPPQTQAGQAVPQAGMQAFPYPPQYQAVHVPPPGAAHVQQHLPPGVQVAQQPQAGVQLPGALVPGGLQPMWQAAGATGPVAVQTPLQAAPLSALQEQAAQQHLQLMQAQAGQVAPQHALPPQMQLPSQQAVYAQQQQLLLQQPALAHPQQDAAQQQMQQMQMQMQVQMQQQQQQQLQRQQPQQQQQQVLQLAQMPTQIPMPTPQQIYMQQQPAGQVQYLPLSQQSSGVI